MDQPRPTQPHQPDDEPQQAPVPPAGPRDRRAPSLGEKIGLVGLGQVIGYALHLIFDDRP